MVSAGSWRNAASDFSHADEDPAIAGDVSAEITRAQRAIKKLATGEGETFSITGDSRNIENNPSTEKWQKTLGSYDMWSSADIRVEGKTISAAGGGARCFGRGVPGWRRVERVR